MTDYANREKHARMDFSIDNSLLENITVDKESVYLQDAQLPLSRRLKKKFTQSYIDYAGGGL